MLLAILLVVGCRVWRLDVPFERDEGEYAYMGQLMLQGVPPYSVAANMKLPGTYAAYAAIMAIFGESIRGVHSGFLLVNAGCVVLLYFVAKRWLGTIAGLASSASYAVLSVGAAVDGLWAHATHFVVLFALGATLLLLRWSDRPQALTLIGSGLLYGLAFLMKQPGIFFALFGGLYIVYAGRKLHHLVVFAASALLPFGIACAILWRAGVFAKFWFWTFRYAVQYVSTKSLGDGIAACLRQGFAIVETNPLLCAAAGLGLFLLWSRAELRPPAVAITGFLVLSWLAVCPGFYFRPHYFVLVLPAVAILTGVFAQPARPATSWLIVAGLAASIFIQRGYLFQMTPDEVVRDVYGLYPFSEAIPVANYVRAHTASTDRIAVIGSEPEIYFYSGRRSVTPYLYVDALIDEHPLVARMQQEYIDDVEAWKPQYLVFASCPPSWGTYKGRVPGLLSWAKPYYEQYYDRVGVADIREDETVYKWDGDAASYRIESSDYVLVLKRK